MRGRVRDCDRVHGLVRGRRRGAGAGGRMVRLRTATALQAEESTADYDGRFIRADPLRAAGAITIPA